MNKTDEIVAGILYETYCAAVGGKAFNGDPLPDWESFRADPKKKIQSDAWIKVAHNARVIYVPGQITLHPDLQSAEEYSHGKIEPLT